MFFGCTVYRPMTREIAGLHRASLGCDRQALLQQRLQTFLAIAPVSHEERSSGSRCWKNSSPQKYWLIRILKPLLAHDLVAEL